MIDKAGCCYILRKMEIYDNIIEYKFLLRPKK